MPSFEGYHPIMTAHYTLDWLSQFKLNQVQTILKALHRPDSIEAVSAFVNRTMRAIMAGHQLLWGIFDGHRLIGTVAIKDLGQPAVTVDYLILPAYADAFQLAEVQTGIAWLLASTPYHATNWRPIIKN